MAAATVPKPVATLAYQIGPADQTNMPGPETLCRDQPSMLALEPHARLDPVCLVWDCISSLDPHTGSEAMHQVWLTCWHWGCTSGLGLHAGSGATHRAHPGTWRHSQSQCLSLNPTCWVQLQTNPACRPNPACDWRGAPHKSRHLTVVEWEKWWQC